MPWVVRVLRVPSQSVRYKGPCVESNPGLQDPSPQDPLLPQVLRFVYQWGKTMGFSLLVQANGTRYLGILETLAQLDLTAGSIQGLHRKPCEGEPKPFRMFQRHFGGCGLPYPPRTDEIVRATAQLRALRKGIETHRGQDQLGQVKF